MATIGDSLVGIPMIPVGAAPGDGGVMGVARMTIP